MKFLQRLMSDQNSTGIIASENQMANLQMSSVEEANVERMKQRLEKVVVGEIVGLDTVLQSNGLQCITVDCGTKRYKTASTVDNLKIGMKLAFAKMGSMLEEQGYVERKEVSGMESQGVFCSAGDLGFNDSSDDIIEIPDDIQIGRRISELIPDRYFLMRTETHKTDADV